MKLWHCGDRLWRPARPEAAGTAGSRHEKACTVMQVGASLGGASLNGAATMWQRGATLGEAGPRRERSRCRGKPITTLGRTSESSVERSRPRGQRPLQP